jgi:hypothetical protein
MKRIFPRFVYFLFVILCLFVSCRQKASQGETANQSRAAFHDSLKNALYYNFDEGEYCRFQDGKYSFDTTFIVNTKAIHYTLNMSVGDVLIEHDFDHDSVDDALVPLTANGGGSGIFVGVVVMLNKNTTPVYSDGKWMGDRIVIDSAAMVGDTICVYSIVQGPDEPMCCPTMPYIFKLLFRGNKLELLNERI